MHHWKKKQIHKPDQIVAGQYSALSGAPLSERKIMRTQLSEPQQAQLDASLAPLISGAALTYYEKGAKGRFVTRITDGDHILFESGAEQISDQFLAARGTIEQLVSRQKSPGR